MGLSTHPELWKGLIGLDLLYLSAFLIFPIPNMAFPRLVRMSSQAYILRLREGLWLPLFILLLNAFFLVHYLPHSGEFAGESLLSGYLFIAAKSLFRSILWASLFWWIYTIPKRGRIRSFLGGLFCGLTILLHYLESFLVSVYGMCYSHSVLLAIAGTNPSEASEFWSSSVSFSPLVRPTLEIIVSAFIALSLKALYQRWAKKRNRETKPAQGTLALYILSIICSLLILTFPTRKTYEWVQLFGTAFDQTISPMDRLLWNTIGFAQETRKIQEGVENMRNIDLGQLTHENRLDNTSIVVIIGETLRRDYMHCYGYPLSNTPHLDSLLKTGDMIRYSDVISPAGNTIESLTQVLTMQLSGSPKPWYEHPTLTTILSKAGYTTYWTSNQESTGAIVQPLNIIASLADSVKYVHPRSIDGDRDSAARYFDEAVLKDLHYAGVNGKPFVQFVHLEGSHPIYSKRFPKEFARFGVKDIPQQFGDERDQILSDYVNSVYYNDYVVSEIIRKYSQKDALVIYFADHGEILFDDPSQPHFSGHGLHPSGVSVPFLVYLSPSLKAKYPDLYPQLEQSKELPIMNDLFTHAFCDLLGIKTKFTDPKLNFFSSSYDSHRPRVIKSMGKILRM